MRNCGEVLRDVFEIIMKPVDATVVHGDKNDGQAISGQG